VVAREFWISEGREIDFERVFGPSGLWAEIFRKSSEFLETELVCESRSELRYRTFDYWRSHLGFERFRERHQADFERLNLLIAAEGMLQKELLLGTFYIDDSDFEDGADLTLA